MNAEPLSELAPAKINLALHVTGQRENGYHDLQSLVVFAEIGDWLKLRPAQKDALHVSGPFASMLAPGQTNLVSRALAGFRRHWPKAVPDGLRIELEKNLPVAAGVGGGSADAAAMLRLLQQASQHPVGDEELFQLAAELGADVPVCLASVPCLVAGVGERVSPLKSFPRLFAVLVNPMVPVPTAEIFSRLGARDNPPMPALPDPLSHATLLGLWLEESRNDLEPAARQFAPVIGETIGALEVTPGVIGARMSGSGATVFALYADERLAHDAAHAMRARFPSFWVACAPIGRPSGSGADQ